MSSVKLSAGRVRVLGVLGATFGVAACAVIGPKANVSILKEEVSSTKAVDNIVVASATGIDSTGNTGKALLASALNAYGRRARPIMAAGSVLSAAGVPSEAAEVLAANYQAEFARQAEEYFAKIDKGEKAAKQPSEIALPAGSASLPKGKEALKSLAPRLKSELSALSNVAKALKSGQGLKDAVERAKTSLELVQQLDRLLFKKMDATYVLVTHVMGDEQAWKSGKNIHYAVALINAETGKLRYFATADAKKGAVPMPYMAQLGSMASVVFDAVSEQDALPSSKKSANVSPAQVHVTR